MHDNRAGVLKHIIAYTFLCNRKIFLLDTDEEIRVSFNLLDTGNEVTNIKKQNEVYRTDILKLSLIHI